MKFYNFFQNINNAFQNFGLSFCKKKNWPKAISFFSRSVFFAKRVFLMKNSLADEPELCFCAKKTTRRQNFEKVGVDFFKKKI
jgi:hypothetical protein